MSVERLALSPQCGFASTIGGNRAHRRRREAQARADRRGLPGGVGIRMSSKTEQMTTTDHDVALERLYADFAANGLMPLWTVRGDLMPRSPSPRQCHRCGVGRDVLPIAERAGAARSCGSRRRAPRDRIRERRPPSRALRDADAVGRGPVPRSEGGGTRASALAERLPLRPRRRRRVDDRRRRSGRDAARRPACSPRDGAGTSITTSPTRRWSGSTASTSRSSQDSTLASSSSDLTT